MTIEEVLSRLAINTGRIAAALEAIANSQGIVSGELPPNNEDDESEEVQPKPAAKKKTKKKTSKKKKASNKQKVGKDDDDDDNSGLTIVDDVRPVLKKLREEVSHAAVKSLLKRYGAITLKDLKEKDYAKVIADAMEELGDEDLDDDEDDI